MGNKALSDTASHSTRRGLLVKAFPPFVLAIVVLARYHTTLHDFWLGDDSQVLKYAISFHPWEYFFSPRVWQGFSSNNFTPWVILSYAADWKIFGLQPYGFYLHHLLSLSFLAVTAYAMLRLWFPRDLSFFIVLLFELSAPFAESARLLMDRHYIEGLVFSLLASYCFVVGVRKESMRMSSAGIVFYMLAVSAKEIYAPLVVLLILLHEGSIRRRLRYAMPWAAALVFYGIWRWYMLGGLVGGYGYNLAWPGDALLFFPRLADSMGGELGGKAGLLWRWLLGCGSVMAIVALFRYNRSVLLSVLAVSPLLLLPVVPVSPHMSSRYVWLAVFCWLVLNGLAMYELRKRGKGLFIHFGVYLWGAFLFTFFFCSSYACSQRLNKGFVRQEKEGRFVLQEGQKADLLTSPGSSPWYYEGLLWLRKNVLRLPDGPGVTFDPVCLCLGGRPAAQYERAWLYDSRENRLVFESLADFADNVCKKSRILLKAGVPLSLVIAYDDSRINWHFGPYKSGSYAVLFGKMAESVYSLPPRGSRIVTLKDSTLLIRLRYESPEGWITYSRALQFTIKKDKGFIKWRR